MREIIGKDVSVVGCTDPSLRGVRGTVVLESMRTLHLDSRGPLGGTKRLIIPKKGAAVLVRETGETVICDDMLGRLEERIVRGSRH